MSGSAYPIIFAICGWSGAGKTTLLEQLIPRLQQKGLQVSIIKHDCHRPELDYPGKNTHRLWSSGARNLLAHDREQIFIRRHAADFRNEELYHAIAESSDIILVEGHKQSALPKLWLENPDNTEIPSEAKNILDVLPWNFEHRLQRAEQIILEWYTRQFANRGMYAGILVGGKSTRMGQDKAVLPWKEQTLLDSTITTIRSVISQYVLLGNQTYPSTYHSVQLPDIPYCSGPLAGILSAFRWQPQTAWLFVACDMPLLNPETIHWLIQQRTPGYWAFVPKTIDQPHPLCAIYEPQFKKILEQAQNQKQFSLQKLLSHPKVKQLPVPEAMLPHFSNCNTHEEWLRLCVNTRDEG